MTKAAVGCSAGRSEQKQQQGRDNGEPRRSAFIELILQHRARALLEGERLPRFSEEPLKTHS